MATFILNNETIKNSHGFYLLNSGGKFDRFNENPVMLYNHDLSMIAGKWLNLHIEGCELKADTEFDEGDPEAVKLKGKVDREYLRGASPGIIVLEAEIRENPTGGNDVYVTSWELCEGSVVSVPSNAGALKIYDKDRQAVSDENVKCYVDNIVKLSMQGNKEQILNTTKMAEIKLNAQAVTALGITETADSGAISAAIVTLKADRDEKNAKLEKWEKEERERLEKQADELAKLAVQTGRATADNTATIVKMALADYDGAKKFIESLPGKQSLAAQIKNVIPGGGSGIPAGREKWNLAMWMKEDMTGLNRLKAEETDVYNEIKKRI